MIGAQKRQLDSLVSGDKSAVAHAFQLKLNAMREALSQILRCEYDGPGLRDCTDNDGVPYQSADLARHIANAEELVGGRAAEGAKP